MNKYHTWSKRDYHPYQMQTCQPKTILDMLKFLENAYETYGNLEIIHKHHNHNTGISLTFPAQGVLYELTTVEDKLLVVECSTHFNK